jgi:ACS family sodium-dependent inorganic phosphate cotransporter-like MFS transporter 5
LFFVAGANFGTIISLPFSGYLCSLTFLGGWPLSFYIFGGLAVFWFVAWLFLVYDTPASHPRISFEEKHYIISQIGDNGVVSIAHSKTAFTLSCWFLLNITCCCGIVVVLVVTLLSC